MFPCSLRRQDCLRGPELAEALHLTADFQHEQQQQQQQHSAVKRTTMARPVVEHSPFWTGRTDYSSGETFVEEEEDGDEYEEETQAESSHTKSDRPLSLFERVVTAHPPILESLLSQIPTRSILNLHQSSRYLRSFLASYPLAWKALSFRLPQPAAFPGSPGIETPDSRERQSRQYALDALLISVVIPLATRLKSLDLCNTAVSGVALVSKVLQPRIGTIEHLSVRGCKNVSIKYHIVPFLQLHSPHQHPWVEKLALTSLYTYRCRHHRRRPYLPSSLLRRDSDSEPTHELIEICHQLGIWTDTAWCPTPGPRCSRRKDYHGNRAAPGTLEVWVPFDRLWRSGNRIGPAEGKTSTQRAVGKLWEDQELGHEGEALGTESGSFVGEGKYLPAHVRKSHTSFVDGVKCDQCGDAILERCETCSIKMHCMGCRKTLCGSCAFNRPIPRRRAKVRCTPGHFFENLGIIALPAYIPFSNSSTPSASQTRASGSERGENKYWWAPGASRSPNLMNELPPGDDSDDTDDTIMHVHANHHLPPPPSVPLKLDMHWCCIEPIFSGGGGVAFLGVGPNFINSGSDRIRAVPLPKLKQYQDPDFKHTHASPDALSSLKNVKLWEEIMGESVDIARILNSDGRDVQANTCPRSLCQDCYRGVRWKVGCRGCKRPLCKEHDFRGLKVRKCGFRDLNVEREYMRNPPPAQRIAQLNNAFDSLRIPAFRKTVMRPEQTDPVSPAFGGEELVLNEDPAQQMARQVSEGSDSMASSQTLMPPGAPNSTPTDRPSSLNNFDMGPSTGAVVVALPVPRPLKFLPFRQRSLSLSGLQDRASQVPSHSALPEPSQRRTSLLPCSKGHPVQWEGCGEYFCQHVRPVGDCRIRCTSSLKECGECFVLVCEFCIQKQPPCTCGYCSTNYHCPACAVKPAIATQCRRHAELMAIEEARGRERKRMEKEKEAKIWADDIASSVGEFYASLDGWDSIFTDAGGENVNDASAAN